jgi:hypothetical protein
MFTRESELSSLACAKCGHANDAAARRCESCHAHLHLVCRQCGVANDRLASRCGDCGARLHRTFWRRLKSRLDRHFNPYELLVIIAGLAALILIVIGMSRQKPAPPAPAGGDSPNAVGF